MARCLKAFFSVLLTITAVFLYGCSKKEDLPEFPAESTQSESTPTEIPQKDLNPKSASNQQTGKVVTLDQVLQVWNSGQQAQAVELFLGIKWDQPDIFAPDSVFRVSEADFAKLPENQRSQIQKKAMKLTKDIREMSKFIVQQAKQKGGYETPRNALIACGKRLSGDDQLLLVQMVGKAVIGYTEKELPLQ